MLQYIVLNNIHFYMLDVKRQIIMNKSILIITRCDLKPQCRKAGSNGHSVSFTEASANKILTFL